MKDSISVSTAPIALFVYNRPVHTERTVAALQQNRLADRSDLFIYSDGPKSEADRANVEAVRKYLKSISGFRNITIMQSENNLGLARSIINGVTEIAIRFGRIIVLEDDLVTSPFFLSYMNQALEIYEHQPRVMHIAAYMFPIDLAGLPQTFFYRQSSCWGWGTWARAWEHFQPDINILISKFSTKMKRKFNIDGAFDFWRHIELNRDQKLNTWAIKWYASVFLANGLCLHPSASLVNNIGCDASGIHCGKNEIFSVGVSNHRIEDFEAVIDENQVAVQKIKRFLKKSIPFYRRLRLPGKICDLLARIIP